MEIEEMEIFEEIILDATTSMWGTLTLWSENNGEFERIQITPIEDW